MSENVSTVSPDQSRAADDSLEIAAIATDEPKAEEPSPLARQAAREWIAATPSTASSNDETPELLYFMKLAEALYDKHCYEEAIQAYQQVLRRRPHSTKAWVGLGVMLHHLGQMRAAVGAYLNAIRLDHDCAVAYTNIGVAFEDLNDFANAEEWQRRAIQQFPMMPAAHNSLGAALMKQGHTGAAIACFLRALALNPDYPWALINLGYTFQIIGNIRAAKDYYLKVLDQHPEINLARFYLGLLHLQEGDFQRGWREYEYRRESRLHWTSRRWFNQPNWQGEPLNGQRILLYCEQGLGDTMQFVRYVKLVAECGGRVVLEVQPGLGRLLHDVAGAEWVIEAGHKLQPFDWQCPLMSLPWIFRTDLDTIPCTVPYLHADPQDRAKWATRLAGNELKIGLVWGGNPRHPRERMRAIPLTTMAALTEVEGAKFYSLQKGAAAEQMKDYTGGKIVNLEAEQDSFADTAAIMANLDLLISIDTSVAHMAGAMAKPVWLALHDSSDWRWMFHRNDTPWYPHTRLWRKDAHEQWTAVIERMKLELQLMVAQRRASGALAAQND